MKVIRFTEFSDLGDIMALAQDTFPEYVLRERTSKVLKLHLSTAISVPTLNSRIATMRQTYPALSIVPVISSPRPVPEAQWQKCQELESWYSTKQAGSHTDSSGDERAMDFNAALMHFAQIISRKSIKGNTDSTSVSVVKKDGTKQSRNQSTVLSNMGEYFDAWEAMQLAYVDKKIAIHSKATVSTVDAVAMPT